MVSNHFDEFIKALATSTSRRKTIKILLAGTLAGFLGSGVSETVLAQTSCTGTGNPCVQDSDCCTNLCYAKLSSGSYVHCDIRSPKARSSPCLCVSAGPGPSHRR